MIGQELVQSGLISIDQLHVGLEEQRLNKTSLLGDILIRLGFLSQLDVARILSTRTGLNLATPSDLAQSQSLLHRIPLTFLQNHAALPLNIHNGKLQIAVADPYDVVTIDRLRRAFPIAHSVHLLITTRDAISDYLIWYQKNITSTEPIVVSGESDNVQNHDDHPVVKYVNSIVSDAAHLGASDIHLEPEAVHLQIRYRIDGVLRQKQLLHLSGWSDISHRIKIMSGMNIADTRSIQDGRFHFNHHGQTIDCRVAIMPSIHGETIVIRLLDRKKNLLDLENLGLSAPVLQRVRTIIQKPLGMTLLSGPTGSGKTTTLYSILSSLNTPDVHIATLEDPIEYHLDNVRQTSIQDQQGLTFAAGVRGLLRMDPDIILIGEIRDNETAQMALRAAMTGHQVFSTLHCSDALGALPRLMDLGLNPRLLIGHLCGLVAQRLVRRLCPACKRLEKTTDEQKHLLGNDCTHVAISDGCKECSNTGRQGRTVVAEAIPMTSDLTGMIADKAPLTDLIAAARQQGFRSIQEDGLDRVRNHEISFCDLKRSVDISTYTQGRHQ